MLTSNNFEMLSSVFKSGCMVLLHHLLTVQLDFPNCSANHLPVFFFSTITTFILFKVAICSKTF